MHSHNLVYRDLKPENIFLSSRGLLKLGDFGFVKQLKPNQRTYTICGTPDYMAPEVRMGTGYSRAADWWAFGILIFEMLTGETPYVKGNDSPLQIYRPDLM